MHFITAIYVHIVHLKIKVSYEQRSFLIKFYIVIVLFDDCCLQNKSSKFVNFKFTDLLPGDYHVQVCTSENSIKF